MKTTIKLLAAMSGALCLSGCASIFGGHQASVDSSQNFDMDQIYHEYAQEQLEQGRKAMKAGAYAAALEPLRKAARDRRSAPAAYNAMGVVYAKIGREEVAQRLFTMALFLEPENKAFAANVLKLKAERQVAGVPDHQLAKNGNNDVPAVLEPAAAPVVEKVAVASEPPVRLVASAYGTAVSADNGTGGIVRLSKHEVQVGRISSATPVAHRSVATAEYPMKIEFRSRGPERLQGKLSSRPSYVQRVNF